MQLKHAFNVFLTIMKLLEIIKERWFPYYLYDGIVSRTNNSQQQTHLCVILLKTSYDNNNVRLTIYTGRSNIFRQNKSVKKRLFQREIDKSTYMSSLCVRGRYWKLLYCKEDVSSWRRISDDKREIYYNFRLRSISLLQTL